MNILVTYTEADRYNFTLERSGEEKALEFAMMVHKSYRSTVLQSQKRGGKVHHASLPEYKRGFIESYLFYKRLLFKRGLL